MGQSAHSEARRAQFQQKPCTNLADIAKVYGASWLELDLLQLAGTNLHGFEGGCCATASLSCDHQLTGEIKTKLLEGVSYQRQLVAQDARLPVEVIGTFSLAPRAHLVAKVSFG